MSDYKPQAIVVVEVLGEIKDAVWDGVGIQDILPVFTALQKLFPIVGFVNELPKAEYDDFIAECIDQAVGTEDHALVDDLGGLSAEQVEQISDGMKSIILVFLNRDQ